jgi:uncharacterized UPF0160 family protein
MEEIKKIKVVTHNSSFHADDLFACAVLSLYFEKQGKSIEIIRTRDESIIDSAEYVLDIGGIYDPEKGRFDHHQHGGAGVRENGIPYATFGIVWKAFGLSLAGSEEVLSVFEQRLVLPIDAGDNGIDTYQQIGVTGPYLLQSMLGTFKAQWDEEDVVNDTHFMKLLEIAKMLIERELHNIQSGIVARVAVEKAYGQTTDKRIVFVDAAYPLFLFTPFKELLLFIYPKSGKWRAEGVLKDENSSFERRFYFPKEWRGFRSDVLSEITGISGSQFCHGSGFLLVADTREAIVALVNKALQG